MTSKQKLKQLLNTPELMQLLQDEQWNELMSKLPIQTKPVLLELLRDCGIEENEVTQLQLKYGIMYGLKHASSTITIGAPDKNGIHNVGNVSNQGMQGGRQLGFMTPADAEHIANQIGNPRVYTMNPSTAKNYTWIKVDTIYGPAYAALEAIGKFKNLDKTLKEKSQQLIDLQYNIQQAERIKENPEHSEIVQKAAAKENLSNLKTICEIIETELDKRGVKFTFNSYGQTFEELCADVTAGKRYDCHINYDIDSNVTQDERLEEGFFQELKKSIKRKLPHLTDLDIYSSYGGSTINVSFRFTYQSPEATKAKDEVIRQSEQLIATSIHELEKLKTELT